MITEICIRTARLFDGGIAWGVDYELRDENGWRAHSLQIGGGPATTQEELAAGIASWQGINDWKLVEPADFDKTVSDGDTPELGQGAALDH